MGDTQPDLAPVAGLERRQIPAAARTLAEAFMGDPLFAYLLEDRAARLSWLRIFMEASLRAVQPAGHCETIVAEDGIVPGVIATTGPGNHRLPLGRRLRMLFRLLPSLLLGRPGLGRVRWGLSVLDEMERRHFDEPHWYVFQLGVGDAYRGKGYGRLLLERVLEQADGDAVAVYLETSNELNIGFYQRFGFEVRDEIAEPDRPSVWTMVRPDRRG